MTSLHAVTGAFGYSGRYIAERLLADGCEVMTLTNSVRQGHPLRGRVHAIPLAFADPQRLAASLRGVEVLYNTYWVRFNHRTFTFADAVRNTRTLFEAARTAGVRRIVHVSITNPSEESPLEYFRGKARLERALAESGIAHTILRPAVLFGREDILVNNIAWALRRLPVFGVFGSGEYQLQPIHVDDLARLAVEEGRASGSRTVDAIGPETYTYRALAETIATIIGRPRHVVSVPPRVGWAAAWMLGHLVGDVIITWDEVRGLMDNLLHVDTPPAGTTKLSEWAAEHRASLGLRYTSELARRRNRIAPYASN